MVEGSLFLPSQLVDTSGVVVCQANQHFCVFDVVLTDEEVSLYIESHTCITADNVLSRLKKIVKAH